GYELHTEHRLQAGTLRRSLFWVKLQPKEECRSCQVGSPDVRIFLQRNWNCGVYRCFDSPDPPSHVRVLCSLMLAASMIICPAAFSHSQPNLPTFLAAEDGRLHGTRDQETISDPSGRGV